MKVIRYFYRIIIIKEIFINRNQVVHRMYQRRNRSQLRKTIQPFQNKKKRLTLDPTQQLLFQSEGTTKLKVLKTKS